ncbi:Smg-4/UPF3 family-domain-containing protein [Pseudomassariella vexata]|uniref:Smg-4/UPF3 family-domain-containing protein n=1 Tax=Pseudomassariella vexata TaxID=1141098 RepID=A0A1Y2DLG2_9PEZI|nr:Smg-4/UPF3 family-domain-containing protein [Pseudomassariella vexata]ORY60082.1 Smg-4/UPF3 family-domain-containing protein [Pseudomassariella vexata]
MSSSNASRKANALIAINANNETTRKMKPPVTGKKVTIRRLPPALTSDEFWTILGDEWREGNGKVDWVSYEPGKVSTKPSRPSQPARCYLRVMKIEDIPSLSDAIQRATWEDAKRSFTDPALVGPPVIENSIYQKVPTGKRRTDPRQGTIDQDPDFMAYLDSLTHPPSSSKDPEADQSGVDEPTKENAKVTSTPLVEYIKERKAAKAKEAASAKSAKQSRQESQGVKIKTSEEPKKRGKDSKSEKVDKTAEKEKEKEKEKPKEPVKLLTKKAAAQEAAEAAKAIAGQIATGKAAEEAVSSAVPKSRRAGIAAAAKILQRDLGLSPGSAHRRARQDAAKAEKAEVVPSKAEASAPSEKATKETKETKDAETPKTAPTGPKAQPAESSRRSRGKKATAAPATDSTKSRENDPPAKPTTGPIILLKKEASKTAETKSNGAASTATVPVASSTSTSTPMPTPPTGPKAAAKVQPASAKAGGQTQAKKSAAQPSQGATRAFVKHANPSQGVTEPLLKQAMEIFGTVTFVEIDKRKGFAYMDFGDYQGLCKAIAASPVSVGQGTVQVLERKEKKPTTPATSVPAISAAAVNDTHTSASTPTPTPSDRPRRGGRGRGRRGGNAAASEANEGGSTPASGAG